MKKSIYIFGAHSRAQTLREYLTFLDPDVVVEAYLVDSLADNASSIGGIPVIEVGGAEKLHSDYPVYIATRSIHHEKITQELKSAGISEIYAVDVGMDRELRNAYVREVYRQKGKKFCLIDDLQCGTDSADAQIYVAQSVFDSKLTSGLALSKGEAIIQVGCELTEQCLKQAVFFDNTGDNISAKNKQFCELTALYWVWKNAQESITGLCHYRRHFILPVSWIERMIYNKVDVILPVPLYVNPHLEGNYRFRHEEDALDAMYDSVKDLYGNEIYLKVNAFFQQGLYSPCNMLIAKKEVFNDVCGFIFPIVNRVCEVIGQKTDDYQNRYPGFLAERLMSFFFESDIRDYNVVYANKNFLS